MGWWIDDVKIVLLLFSHKCLEHSHARKIASKFLAMSRVEKKFFHVAKQPAMYPKVT
jgi:hypothetical protein